MIKKLTACTLTAAVMGAGQMAFAHTGIKDPAVEGQRVYTGFTITHGCSPDHDTPQIPVIAQSVVFPNAAAKAFKLVPNPDPTLPPDEVPTNITNHIEGSLADLKPTALQDKSIFNKMRIVKDADGNTRVVEYTDGSLDKDAIGITPFRIQAPTFKAGSCAKSLKVRFAIANWCSTSQDTNDDARVDVWIGNTTALFNDPDVVSVGYWPTLTVSRDLVNNPLNPACGEGFDIAVQPWDTAIDARLPIKGYWPTP